MLSSVADIFLQAKGGLMHTGRWVASTATDRVIKNPRFKPHAGFEKGIVIYCLPGTADRSYSFKTFADHIIHNLPPLISSIHLVSFDGRVGAGIPEFAKQLEQKIRDNNDENVIILGHSRGGIIASYLDVFHAKQANIKIHGIVPSCSPYKGDNVPIVSAFLALFSTSIQQMQKKSKFLSDLEKKIEQSKTPYYPIAAANDSLVAIDDACIPAHRDQLRIIPRHGHLSITSSHTWIRHIHASLTEICLRLVPEMEVVPIHLEEGQAFELLDPTVEIVMMSVCKEIDEQIFHLAQRVHLADPTSKARVLLNLRNNLMEMLEGAPNHYPSAQTVGGYIEAFLNDNSSAKKPIDILNEQLNYPFSIFQKTKPSSSIIFIKELIDKYRGIPLRSDNPDAAQSVAPLRSSAT